MVSVCSASAKVADILSTTDGPAKSSDSDPAEAQQGEHEANERPNGDPGGRAEWSQRLEGIEPRIQRHIGLEVCIGVVVGPRATADQLDRRFRHGLMFAAGTKGAPEGGPCAGYRVQSAVTRARR